MQKIIKAACDYLPLIIFFTLYKTNDMIVATASLVITSILAAAILWVMEKKLPLVPLIVAGVVTIFGGITVYSGDSSFIKLKPTIVNLILAVILLGGVFKGKGLLKGLFSSALSMEDKHWLIFSKRWAVFFIILAVINEVVWRNFSEDIWVDFKLFGILGLTFVFMILNIPFLNKHSQEIEKTSNN